MAQLASKIINEAPAAPASAIDRGQLARMTFGDRRLEREVLQLFDRQAGKRATVDRRIRKLQCQPCFPGIGRASKQRNCPSSEKFPAE